MSPDFDTTLTPKSWDGPEDEVKYLENCGDKFIRLFQ
jgi:hypothetical protein